MKCLVVDDQEENRVILSTSISPYGRCDLVANGSEAVELFRLEFASGEPYDLVLMDIMMPVMDGQEALQKIRDHEKNAGIPVGKGATIIMVTAVDAHSEVTEAFEEGLCTDYINKPINRSKLLVKLAEHNIIPEDWWKISP
jgi:two-component system, chemotaxis family, chemotaxis protein CheY